MKIRVRSLVRRSIFWLKIGKEKYQERPFEVSLSLALALFGTRVLINGLHVAPGSVQALPLWLACAYCTLAVLGGLSVITGMFLRLRLEWAYGLERFGLFVSGSAWASYIVGLSLGPITVRSTLLILALVALTTGCIARARSLSKQAEQKMAALRLASKLGGEG